MSTELQIAITCFVLMLLFAAVAMGASFTKDNSMEILTVVASILSVLALLGFIGSLIAGASGAWE